MDAMTKDGTSALGTDRDVAGVAMVVDGKTAVERTFVPISGTETTGELIDGIPRLGLGTEIAVGSRVNAEVGNPPPVEGRATDTGGWLSGRDPVSRLGSAVPIDGEANTVSGKLALGAETIVVGGSTEVAGNGVDGRFGAVDVDIAEIDGAPIDDEGTTIFVSGLETDGTPEGTLSNDVPSTNVGTPGTPNQVEGVARRAPEESEGTLSDVGAFVGGIETPGVLSEGRPEVGRPAKGLESETADGISGLVLGSMTVVDRIATPVEGMAAEAEGTESDPVGTPVLVNDTDKGSIFPDGLCKLERAVGGD